MRLIDADMLINEFDQTFLGNNPRGVIRATIENTPTIEPERKKWRWEPIIEANEFGEPYQAGVYCSRCGEMNTYEPNYCPNCGADMRQVGGDTE